MLEFRSVTQNSNGQNLSHYVYSTLSPLFPWQSCNVSLTSLEVKHKTKKCSKVFISFKTSCIHPPKNRLLSVPLIINRYYQDPTAFGSEMCLQYSPHKTRM